MPFFLGIFEGSRSILENELEELYTDQLSKLLGWDISRAREEVKGAIQAIKETGEREGVYNLSDNLGDTIISAAKEGHKGCMEIVNRAKNDGTTEEDIKEWWNMPHLQRQMVIWSENMFRYSVFWSTIKNDGLSADDAMEHIRKMFPMYGDPEGTKNASGDDKPLPGEIRGRVDRYRQSKGSAYITKKVMGFSTYNAFIRDEIRKGIV